MPYLPRAWPTAHMVPNCSRMVSRVTRAGKWVMRESSRRVPTLTRRARGAAVDDALSSPRGTGAHVSVSEGLMDWRKGGSSRHVEINSGGGGGGRRFGGDRQSDV